MTRSLVIAPQWIGDAVLAEPLLARLAQRGESLTVAALPWVAPVVRAMAAVDDVVELPFARGRLDWSARRRLARALRGEFSRAYVLPNTLKSALLPWLAGISQRIGYHGEGRWGLLTERLPNPSRRPAMVGHYLALARESLTAEELAARPNLQLDPDALATALHSAGLAAGSYWVFAPGAEYGPAKRWPVSHYAALAQRLHAEQPLPIVLLGSGKEAALCDELAALAPRGSCRVLAGRTSLDVAIALIAGACGLVSNDSGLMHIGAAFRLPQVALFGSTSPEHTPPLNPLARVLWLRGESPLTCIPCFERTCRYGHYRCLADIAPARAEHALADALSAHAAASAQRP